MAAKTNNETASETKPARAKTYTVTSPVKGFQGVRCGLVFKDGKAKTTNKALAVRMLSLGYSVPRVTLPKKTAKK